MKELVENAVKPHLQEGYGPQSLSCPPNGPIESEIRKFAIASYRPIEFQKKL